MTRDLHCSAQRSANRRHNFAAALVAGGAIAFLYYQYEPATAEEGLPAAEAKISRLDVITQPVFVKNPVEENVPAPQEMIESFDPQRTASLDSIHFVVDQLTRGVNHLENHATYSALFERQERINGELKDNQQIEIKLRHAPFSVYMKWLSGDKGRELLYATNENEGKMLVKLGGFKGRLLPTLKLDPQGDRAAAESRHPVTRAGLVNLAKELISHREHDLQTDNIPICKIEEGHLFDGRACYKVYVEYPDQKLSPIYRHSVTLIDKELSLPVYVKNYTWPNANTVNVDEETLIECYAYTDIQFEKQLADTNWEQDNPDYRFQR